MFSSSKVEEDRNRKEASGYDEIPGNTSFIRSNSCIWQSWGITGGIGVDDDDELSVVELELAGVDDEELAEAGAEEDEDATLELARFDEDELAETGAEEDEDATDDEDEDEDEDEEAGRRYCCLCCCLPAAQQR